MKFRISPIAVIGACLMLSACGEGWVPQLTTDMTPYGNSRTAGSGVVYVRANMMPAKTEIKGAQSVERTWAPTQMSSAPKAIETKPAPSKPMMKADEIFNDAAQK